MKKNRPSKYSNLIKRVRNAVESGEYRDLTHARIRGFQRKITRPEYEFVLLHGHHEPSKDVFQPEFGEWNYAFRGQTVDGRELRVVVSFDSNNMLIITLIALEN